MLKFADKLFFTMVILLTLIFTVFGVWMLHSNFSRLLDRELEQGSNESRLFHFLFEMGCRSVEEYGVDFAVNRTMESISNSVERNGSRCFVLRENGGYYYGQDYMQRRGFDQVAKELVESLGRRDTYGYCIRKVGDEYYMLTATISNVGTEQVYLGTCRNLTAIYTDRGQLLAQYRIALVCLLFVGGIGIYLLSRYITRPIESLDKLAGRIAEGNYEFRSHNKSRDEVGSLARSFNRMADRLVDQMEAKALEAKQKEDFTAAFAHELKTPLTSIIGYADMLNSIDLSEQERHEAYFYIYSQGKRLESLSHKLLELVSMDKGSEAFRQVNVKTLEENIRTTMRPIWKNRGIRGRVNMDRGFLYGDAELLLSLFYNLLDNAVKAVDKERESFILLKGTAKQDGYEVKDNNLDFAIAGEGFFQVLLEDGTVAYTRNGELSISIGADGLTLSNSDGYPILGTDGQPIVFDAQLDTSRISTDEDGRFWYRNLDDTVTNLGMRFGLVQFSNPSGLFKISGSLVTATDASGEPRFEVEDTALKQSKVLSKYLEGSNVEAVDEMVNLIVAQRAYEMNSKVITASDEMLQQANNLRR